jgi:NAD+ kinase
MREQASAFTISSPLKTNQDHLTLGRFATIALVGRYQTPGVAEAVSQIAAFLGAANRRVILESETAKATGLRDIESASIPELGACADLAIVLGGDGTMLGVARELAPFNVPLVGINHGRLGFITDVALRAWREALGPILQGEFEIEHRQLLCARVLRGTSSVFSALALNDVVVGRSSGSRMIELDVAVNEQFMYTQRADGLIISTPTGSTAYSLSANGPILHPQLQGIVLVPVAPQALGSRPIVLPDDSVIRIQMRDASETRVHCDMQTFADLQDEDQVEVRRAEHAIRFVHPRGYSYFDTLRRKLNWQALPTMGHSSEPRT